MQKTSDIAARLLPMPKEAREKLLQRFPKDRQHVSQLADMFDGTWYVHRGDLVIDGDFESTLNLVVEGDLIVRGNLSDADGEASLVVTGDVSAINVLSSHLMVVMGSLHSSGLVHADYNDYAFEVWGAGLTARALILTDKSALLPEARQVEFEFDSDELSGKGRAEDFLAEELLRWQDADFNDYRRVVDKGVERWLAGDGTPLSAAEAKQVKFVRSIPADFGDIAGAVYGHRALFRKPSPVPLDWQLDRAAPPELVAKHAASTDARSRVAAAAHPQLSAEWVQRLATDTDALVRVAIAHHPRLGVGEAATLATDRDPEVRRQLAASTHAGPHLEALVNDASSDVRRACASHTSLTDAQRRKLLHDAEKAVRGRALRYLPVTESWVRELRSAEEESLVAWAIEHQDEVAALPAKSGSTASSDWQKDLIDPRAAVRKAALRQVPPGRLFPFLEQHRDRFVRDEVSELRAALATATRDAKTLEILCSDTDRLVRRFALDNLAIPESLLLAEATRLSKAPASSWNTSDAAYIDHMSDLQDLLKHPRLSAEALRTIHRVYPRSWRLEPHRNMPLDVILERAVIDSFSVESLPGFSAWQKLSQNANADQGPAFAAMLSSDESYLQSAARMSASTPAPALLAHARVIKDDRYSLEEIAQNPQLKASTRVAEDLRQLLLSAEVVETLARNPDLPTAFLKSLAEQSLDQATLTLWQAHGVAGEGVPMP